MKRRVLLCLGIVAPALALWACTGDDDVFRPSDARTLDSGTVDRAAPAMDGAAPLACGDAGAAPPRVLLVEGHPGTSELAAVNMTTKSVDGRLTFDGGYGVTSSAGTDPYLLAGETDIVTRLDAREPWKAVGSWNVHGDDATPNGDPNANPVGLVQVSCSKAYVLRYNRNKIAIIDPSRPGTVNGYIDLGALHEAADPNMVEMTSAVYVPAKKRVYVLLGNVDFTTFVKVNGIGKLVCRSLKPSIVAIDVDTDKVVSLGGTALGGGIALEGYNPAANPLVYDAALDRLLVLQGGCNVDRGDAGPGDMIRRRVEEVDLATGTVKTLLPLDDREFPSSLAFVSKEQAAIAFFFDGYHWDTTKPALGEAIAGGIDIIATDGRGGFVGTRQPFIDGGPGPLQVVTVPAGDAGSTVVYENPFTRTGGYVAGIEAWPHR
jgi:hypothetical protein